MKKCNNNKNSYFRLLLISSVSAAVLSACGGSGSSSTTTPVVTPTEDVFPSQVTAPNVMVVNESGSLILAETGLSLYTFDSDTLGTSVCEGTPAAKDTCAGKWPPLLVADGGVANNEMTIVTRSDATQQWAYNGMPLYHWHLDNAQGDIGGDGIGSVWYLARPAPLRTSTLKNVDSYVGNQTVTSVTSSSDVLTSIRTNKDGFTLYTFDNDPINNSACIQDCINAWPPLFADAGAIAQAPLSIVTLANEHKQWAYKGKPLYFFTSDNAAGDINGDDVGNVWHVATQEPAIERTTDNGRSLSATGNVKLLLPVGNSTTDFTLTEMDKDGFSLYTFDNDSAGVSNCADQCLVNWPAFLPNDEDKAVGDFTIFERADGTKQWAHLGMPLYFFVNDTAKGDINGDGLGDVWHLITTPTLTSFKQEVNTLGAAVTVSGNVHTTRQDQAINKTDFALYTFDNDTAGVSNCQGSCLDNWPALLADDKDVAVAPFSIISRGDGVNQWAINDMPLYFFTPDTTPDDVQGENVGNIWHIARPAPVKVDVHAIKGNLFAAQGDVLDSQGKTSVQLMGLTLYTFDADIKDSGASTCFGDCATTWPPLYATSADQAFGDFTIVERSDNNITTFQWSYNGLPLYFFVGDVNVGDTNGDVSTWTIATP